MGKEVKHDLATDLESSRVHLREVLVVREVVVVRCHAQITRDVFQDELDQEEELSVEDLAIDNELNIVFLDHLFDLAGDVGLHCAVIDE